MTRSDFLTCDSRISRLAVAMIALAIPSLATAATLRVGAGQTYATIQAAINASVNGDEIIVEPGAYAESINLNGKAVNLHSRTGALNTYVLPSSAGQTIVSCVTSETAATIVDGFTFLNASGACGIRVTSASPIFRNCTIQNCQVSAAPGGGLIVGGTNPEPRFESCVITGNRATNQSGAAAYLQTGLTTFTGCYFQSNECVGGLADLRGAAIYALNGRFAATNCTFSNNAVRVDVYQVSSTNIFARGGAVYIENAASSLTDCTFAANLAHAARSLKCCYNPTGFAFGGTVYEAVSASTYLRCSFVGSIAEGFTRNEVKGGAMYFAAGADPTIDTCTFTNPRANSDTNNSFGGALFYEPGCLGTIRNSTIDGAQARSQGGAIYLQAGAAPIVTDTTIKNCFTPTDGGGVWVSAANTNDSSPIFVRVTFANCSSTNGGGLHIRDNSQLVLDSCRFTGCTAPNGQGGGIYTWYAPITVRNTAFDLNTSPTGSAIRTNGDTNRYPSLRGNFFCGNSGTSTNWVNGTWIDAPPFNTNQFAAQCSTDCNNNGIYDNGEIASGAVPDCNGNQVPDSCDIAAGAAVDCNNNGRPDSCDIAAGTTPDCNGNGRPDSCDIATGTAADCNGNGRPDSCDIASSKTADCDANGVPDSCQADCDGDGIPNPCEIAAGAPDCNGNGVPDACDLIAGTLTDRNKDGVPDSCQRLDYLGLRSEFVPIAGTAADPYIPSTAVCMRVYAEFSDSGADLLGVYGNPANPLTISISGGGFFQAIGGANTTNDLLCMPEVPSASFAYDSWLTIGRACMDANVLQVVGFNWGGFVTANGFTDDDCIAFLTPGSPQAYAGPTKRILLAQLTTRTGVVPVFRVNLVGRNSDSSDWNAYAQVAPAPVMVDCNQNGIQDAFDVAFGGISDCNDNGVPDSCEFADFLADCNSNGVPDRCDIFAGTSQDLDNTGIPDECECVGDVNGDGRVNVDDIVAVIIAWGDFGTSPADLNGDDIVNAQDLALVLGGYGECQ